MSEQDIMFLSLKYDRCNYRIEWHEGLKTNIIQYDEPANWPAFFMITLENADTQTGVFTSQKKINLAFINYNEEKES